MGVIRDCDRCGSHGCPYCEPIESVLEMLYGALETLSEGSEPIGNLLAARAARKGIYRSGDPRNSKKKASRIVDAPCASCGERLVIDIEGLGYICRGCGRDQPVEFTDCVYCKVESAVKRIDSHVCLLCERDQPSEANVVSIIS